MPTEDLLMPVEKKTVEVEVKGRDPQTGEDSIETVDSLIVDDAAHFLGVISQIQFGMRRKRKYREAAGRVLEEVRDFNFSHSLDENLSETIQVPDAICNQVYEALTKEDINLRGAGPVAWSVKFEKWFLGTQKATPTEE